MSLEGGDAGEPSNASRQVIPRLWNIFETCTEKLQMHFTFLSSTDFYMKCSKLVIYI